jgi:uncharacterized protein YggL (DUF469 family)
MSQRAALSGCLLAAVAVAVGLRAGDDLVVDDVSVEPPAETVRFAPVVGHGLGGRPGGITEYDLEALFDQHVFRRLGGLRPVGLVNGRMVVKGDAAAPAGETLERLAFLRPLAERRIETLDRICGLTEPQREVLRLAAESDLRRLAGEIDLVRQKHVGQRVPATPLGIDRERLQAVRDDAAACRRRIEQIFRPGSLLCSVSLGMLAPSHRSAVEAWLAARRKTRWEAMVRTVLGQVDTTSLGFSADQHDTILQHLLADVPALEVFGDASEAATSARTADFQTLLVLSRLKRLDQASLRKLCDPRQWSALEQLMGQHGDPEAVEQLLVAQGVLEERE